MSQCTGWRGLQCMEGPLCTGHLLCPPASFRLCSPINPCAGLCKLDLVLVSQSVESVWLSALYPVNSMRNRALANAKTDVSVQLCGAACRESPQSKNNTERSVVS
jgi:hypothetical protein